MRQIKFFIALLLIAAFALFVVQNLETVRLRFAVWSTQLSLALPLLLAYFLGAFTARPVLRFLNRRRKERKVERRVDEARREGLAAADRPAA